MSQSSVSTISTPKAVIYARYSSHSQTEQSIEGQLRVNNDFAEREGYTIVGEYIDRAISGKSADARPEFQRMINDAKKHGFEYVIVYKLDRFARNRYDSAIYKHKLNACGVRVISATEKISENAEGVILEAILEASAEYYSLELSQKVKRGLKESALKGTFTGGFPPFGYKVVDKRVIIDEETAPIIKYVFEQYADSRPKKEIVNELNAKGYRSSTGKPFTVSSFQHCLKNRKYIGKVTYSGVEYENTFPPLISDDLFEKVQERLKQTAHAPAAKKAKQEYLLQGKAFCGMCGTALVGENGRGKGGTKYYYYACGERKRNHTCKKKTEKKDFLEWYIVEQTVEYVLTPDRIEYIAEKVVEEYDKEFNNSRVNEYKKRIDKLEREANKLLSLIIATENMTIIKRYENQIELLDLQKADLEIDLSKLQIANKIRYTKKDIVSWLKQFCKGDLFDNDFRKKIIDTFVNAVYVYDDKVIIYYNIKNSKQVSFIDNNNALDSDSNYGSADISENKNVRISNLDLRQSRTLDTVNTCLQFMWASIFLSLK